MIYLGRIVGLGLRSIGDLGAFLDLGLDCI